MGQARAIEFAKEGADVVINYPEDAQGAEETKRQVEEAGRRALVFQADLRGGANVAKLFREATSLGTPYILVNNAGTDSVGKNVADMSIEEWDDRIKSQPPQRLLLFSALHPRPQGGGRQRQNHQRHLGSPGDP